MPLYWAVSGDIIENQDAVHTTLFFVSGVLAFLCHEGAIFGKGLRLATLSQPARVTKHLKLSGTTLKGGSAWDTFVITYADAAVGAYLIYGLLNLALVRHGEFNELIRVLAGYTLFRTLPDKMIVVYALAISGAIQGLIAVGQSLWMLPSTHDIFTITGALGNPGLLGGYLSICFILALRLIVKCLRNKTRIGGVLSTMALLIIAAGLILSDSRAGWLAAICGTGLFISTGLG